jgi:hypothetical protein
VTLDLGPEMDHKYLQTEGTYQLIVSLQRHDPARAEKEGKTETDK